MSLDFMKIYKTGKINIGLFQNPPEIYSLGLDEDLENLAKVREELSLQSVIFSISRLCKIIIAKKASELVSVSEYITTVMVIIYKERITKEVLSEFSAKISEFYNAFTEENRLQLDGFHRASLNKFRADNICGLFKKSQGFNIIPRIVQNRPDDRSQQGLGSPKGLLDRNFPINEKNRIVKASKPEAFSNPINNPPPSLNKSPMSQSVNYSDFSNKSPLKIPHRSYDQSRNQPVPKENPFEPPDSLSIIDNEFREMFTDIIQNYKDA